MTTDEKVAGALRWLERHGSRAVRDALEPKYGITTARAFGVGVGQIQKLAKQLGRDHALALALWETGWYEARLLTAYVDEPGKVTSAQMDRWVKQFDNWGIVDTLCFALWDRTPHAWKKVAPWCARTEEFVRRSGFVMLACLALHDRSATDADFLAMLPLFEKYADDRNFVRKGAEWALRSIARRSQRLKKACAEVEAKLRTARKAASAARRGGTARTPGRTSAGASAPPPRARRRGT